MRGGRTGRRALKPAQGLERGRDGGEVKVMTVTRAGHVTHGFFFWASIDLIPANFSILKSLADTMQ
jgi:hypothetical protein